MPAQHPLLLAAEWLKTAPHDAQPGVQLLGAPSFGGQSVGGISFGGRSLGGISFGARSVVSFKSRAPSMEASIRASDEEQDGSSDVSFGDCVATTATSPFPFPPLGSEGRNMCVPQAMCISDRCYFCCSSSTLVSRPCSTKPAPAWLGCCVTRQLVNHRHRCVLLQTCAAGQAGASGVQITAD